MVPVFLHLQLLNAMPFCRCYAFRYPDLMQGYCKGDPDQCDASVLFEHWETHGQDEGRSMTCRSQDAKCCAPPMHPPPARCHFASQLSSTPLSMSSLCLQMLSAIRACCLLFTFRARGARKG